MNRIDKFLCTYVVVGLFSFGYSYNADYTYGNDGLNVSRALVCAAAWPAYAVVKAFSWIRPERHHGSVNDGN